MHYNNYHKHTDYSNIMTLDCIVKPEDYVKRTLELGEKNLFTTEHGWTGDVHQYYSLCNKNNLKCIAGAEAYYVDDNTVKDKNNYHIIIICLNREGYLDLNRILSMANIHGYYYKPRIDKKLLLSLNPDNVIITTACVAGRLFKTDNYEQEFLIPVMEHFKNHFYLEVQAHTAQTQKEYNAKIIKVHEKYHIPLIHADDSHYIKPSDAEYRTKFLKAKGICYPAEDGFILDYPDSDTIIQRYHQQNILTDDQIQEALNNTQIFDNCQDLSFTTEIKIPKLDKNKDSNQILKGIINKQWKKKRNEIPKDKWKNVINGVRQEVKIIEETGMADYFIDDYRIVDRAVNKYHAFLTRTGRGSSVSFVTNYILGFTQVNRIVNNAIPLYPSRFMSKARILQTRSLPDIDLNLASREEIIQASKDILGDDNVYYMVSYKPMQDSSAFRLWCKANDYEFNEYNEIAKDLPSYENDPRWSKVIDDSKVFRGVIESISASPCSVLLYDKPISTNIGLLRLIDKTTGNIVYCACMDKHTADEYKFLKNDYLQAQVLNIIKNTCSLAGIECPTINELENLIDDKTWDIYAKGYTATVNQCDSDFARPLVMKYKPHTIAEMASFIAAIRPGFSLLSNFLNRKPYSTNVPQIDNLLESSQHYILFQENIMQFLIFCGIDEDLTYGIIKSISHKTITEEEFIKLKNQVKAGYVKKIGSDKGFDDVWKSMESASKYSFNSSHALSYAYDSLYCAYLKSHYPLEYFTVILNMYDGDIDETHKIIKELPAFSIKIKPIKFRHSHDKYYPDKSTNTIYKGIASVKYLSADISNQLYELKDKPFKSFVDFLQVNPCNTKQTEILIKLNFFSEFGKTGMLMTIFNLYNKLNGKRQFNKKKLPCDENILKKYSTETKQMYKNVNIDGLMQELITQIPNKDLSLQTLLQSQCEYLGYIDYINEKLVNYYIVLDINAKYSPKIKIYSLQTGNTEIVKINKKTFASTPFDKNVILHVLSMSKRNKMILQDGKWCKLVNEFDTWINNYTIVR